MLARTLFIALGLGCSAVPAALGTTWVVRSDGTGDFTRIQPAIDAATSGDIVLVADDVYTGDGNRDLQIVGKDITVRSESGNPSACIIDCGDAGDPHTAFWIDSGTVTSATIDGFLIRNAYSPVNGAAAVLVRDTPPRVAVETIEGRSPSGTPRGSGRRDDVAAAGRPFITVSRCSIVDCGVTGIKYDAWNTAALIENCSLENLTTGINILYTSAIIDGCEVRSCTEAGISATPSEGLQVIRCQVRDCGGSGLVSLWYALDVTVDDCEFTGNGGWGADLVGDYEYWQYELHDIVATGNDAGGLRVRYNGLNATNVTAEDNGGPGMVIDADWDRTLTACRFENNQGNGIYCLYTPSQGLDRQVPGTSQIENCVIQGNAGDGVGGSAATDFTGPPVITVQSSVVTNNGGWGVNLETVNGSGSLTIQNVTLLGNQAGALALDFSDCTIAATLATGNGGAIPIARSAQVASVTITCTDLWSNAAGDWIDWLEPYAGVDGNFSADPLLCDDPAQGSTEIGDVSPCAPGFHPNGVDCGLIGGSGTACSAEPTLEGIEDVPNDQGRQVRLVWAGSLLDRPSAIGPVTAYAIYRRLDGPWPARIVRDNPHPGGGNRLLGWGYLDTVPARGDGFYQYVAPTVCDSTAAGICWSTFFVSALTSDPAVYFDSSVERGYSVDNLAPPVPAEFVVVYGHQNELSWEQNPAPDLVRFEIYRGTTPDFPISYEHLVHQTLALNWTDPEGNWGHVYQLVAVDGGENRSDPAVAQVTGLGRESLPRSTSLVRTAPNPFNPSTTIEYEIARTEPVRLRVYDVAGRVVRELVAGEVRSPGRYEVMWNGCDDAGRHVASGTYAVRLQAGESADTHLVTLVK